MSGGCEFAWESDGFAWVLPGGGAITSVNGDTGPAVLLDAGDIPSTGPSTVQADLSSILESTPTGVWKKVESWAEFIALPGVTEGPVGVWNFDEKIFSAGVITAAVGARLVGGENSSIFGIEVFESVWIFDVDGPCMSGPLRLQGLTVVQLNAGASANVISLSTSLGRVSILHTCITVGGRIGVEIINCASPVSLDICGVSQCDRGIVLRGNVAEVVIRPTVVFSLAQSDSVACELESSVVMSVASAVVFTGVPIEIALDQHAYAISHSVSVAKPALIQISGGGSSGPQGQFLRQTNPGVTDMDINDDRLVIAGSTSQADWRATLIASRTDPADPIIVLVSGAGATNLIPYNDAAQNLALAASTENHMVLALGPAVPGTDWHVQYTGPLAGVTVNLGVEGLARRASAGPSLTEIKWQKNTAPAYAGWVDILDTSVTWSSSNAYTTLTGTAIATDCNTDDRFRPVLVNQTDGVDIWLGVLQTNLEIGK